MNDGSGKQAKTLLETFRYPRLGPGMMWEAARDRIVAHWRLSSRAVFTGHVATHGPARARQKALFVFSALVGLGLTTGIVWAGDAGGIDPRLATLGAIGLCFFATWLLRSRVVFR